MIYVCDAIMGTGKSQSAITYMNEHKDQKFVYISPYLDEAERIFNGCPDLCFEEPKKLWEFGGSKVKHTLSLLEQGKNIATTHQAFKMYDDDTLAAIREHGYSIIIDESLDMLECCDVSEGDIQLLLEAGYIEEDNGRYKLVKHDYNGAAFRDFMRRIRSQYLTRVDAPTEEYGSSADETESIRYKAKDGDIVRLFYWVLSPELLNSFNDVFILTYLFKSQSLHHMLEIYNMEYKYIGIEMYEGGNGFRFCDCPGFTPEYVSKIKDMIEIVDNDKLNAIGDNETSLSVTWFSKRKKSGVETLKNNIYNVFRNVWCDSEAENRMWSTYKSSKESLKGRGYTTGFGALNLRASNKFRDKKYLVYACNLYMNVTEKLYYLKNGIAVDDDQYALSIMIQWIWRSAIRDGEKIYLYLPSKRMRRILMNWMNSLSAGGSAVASM